MMYDGNNNNPKFNKYKTSVAILAQGISTKCSLFLLRTTDPRTIAVRDNIPSPPWHRRRRKARARARLTARDSGARLSKSTWKAALLLRSHHGSTIPAACSRQLALMGPWECASCGVGNHAGRRKCTNTKCRAPKPSSASVDRQRDHNGGPGNSWRCTCGYHNYGFRWSCHRCEARITPTVGSATGNTAN